MYIGPWQEYMVYKLRGDSSGRGRTRLSLIETITPSHERPDPTQGHVTDDVPDNQKPLTPSKGASSTRANPHNATSNSRGAALRDTQRSAPATVMQLQFDRPATRAGHNARRESSSTPHAASLQQERVSHIAAQQTRLEHMRRLYGLDGDAQGPGRPETLSPSGSVVHYLQGGSGLDSNSAASWGAAGSPTSPRSQTSPSRIDIHRSATAPSAVPVGQQSLGGLTTSTLGSTITRMQGQQQYGEAGVGPGTRMQGQQQYGEAGVGPGSGVIRAATASSPPMTAREKQLMALLQQQTAAQEAMAAQLAAQSAAQAQLLAKVSALEGALQGRGTGSGGGQQLHGAEAPWTELSAGGASFLGQRIDPRERAYSIPIPPAHLHGVHAGRGQALASANGSVSAGLSTGIGLDMDMTLLDMHLHVDEDEGEEDVAGGGSMSSLLPVGIESDGVRGYAPVGAGAGVGAGVGAGAGHGTGMTAGGRTHIGIHLSGSPGAPRIGSPTPTPATHPIVGSPPTGRHTSHGMGSPGNGGSPSGVIGGTGAAGVKLTVRPDGSAMIQPSALLPTPRSPTAAAAAFSSSTQQAHSPQFSPLRAGGPAHAATQGQAGALPPSRSSGMAATPSFNSEVDRITAILARARQRQSSAALKGSFQSSKAGKPVQPDQQPANVGAASIGSMDTAGDVDGMNGAARPAISEG